MALRLVAFFVFCGLGSACLVGGHFAGAAGDERAVTVWGAVSLAFALLAAMCIPYGGSTR